MFRRKRKPLPEPGSFDTAPLRDAASHLTGWTYTMRGDYRFEAPPTLLYQAADEIERLQLAVVALLPFVAAAGFPEPDINTLARGRGPTLGA
jgi:hypothetical protein